MVCAALWLLVAAAVAPLGAPISRGQHVGEAADASGFEDGASRLEVAAAARDDCFEMDAAAACPGLTPAADAEDGDIALER
eukprot:scaffold542376_cov17-Prasinocladus_malaysianus.AAC.1